MGAAELTWLPAWRIRELIGKQEVSCAEVTDHFLGRIEDNPQLHAFAKLDVAGAREQAERADAAVRDGDELGPLHGVPTAIKESVHVAGFPLKGAAPSSFDHIGVERLRAAGAVIVGINTSMGTAGGGVQQEGAVGGVYNAFNWDAEARNPWDTTRVPGWSSSGGASAAAAALLPFTIGSDGGGSTRLPAAYSGVVGVHPSRGLIPHIDYDKPSFSLAITIGPLARSVRDAAIVTQVMGGPDGRDPVCLPQEPPDYLERIDSGVEGMRMAWTDDFGFTSTYASDDSAATIALAREAALGLGTLGASVEPTAERWEPKGWGTGTEPTVYDTSIGAVNPNLPRPAPEEYRKAAELRARNVSRFQRLFRDHDVLLSVTAQRVAMTVEEWNAAWTTDGGSYPGGSFAPTYISHTSMFNWLGFPAVSVPCGFVRGLPVGLQIVGWPGTEDRVFRVANAFQTAFPRDAKPSVN